MDNHFLYDIKLYNDTSDMGINVKTFYKVIMRIPYLSQEELILIYLTKSQVIVNSKL